MSPKGEIDYTNTPFLKGTVGAHLDRLNLRAQKLLADNRTLIEGQTVLDIASNDGRFSHGCLVLGAKHVHGVEGRQHHVDEATSYFSELGYRPEQYRFECGDIFEFLPRCEPGQYDVILCFGFLYHTIRQVEMFQHFRNLNPKCLILDSYVHPQRQWMKWLRILWRFRPKHMSPASFRELVDTTEADEIMQLAMEDAAIDGNSIVSGGSPVREVEKSYNALAMNFHPSSAVLERLLDYHGFDMRAISWATAEVARSPHMSDYKSLKRVSYVATPKTSAS